MRNSRHPALQQLGLLGRSQCGITSRSQYQVVPGGPNMPAHKASAMPCTKPRKQVFRTSITRVLSASLSRKSDLATSTFFTAFIPSDHGGRPCNIMGSRAINSVFQRHPAR